MTKREALTNVLEACKVLFENGKTLSINGMVFVNYGRKMKITFDYNECGDIVDAVYIVNNGGTVACIMADIIKKVVASDDNIFLTDDDNTKVFGYINGDKFRIMEGGETK